MTDLSRADVVVALRWQAREMEEGWHPTIPLEIAERAAILRALADSLREGVDDTYPIVNEHGLRAIGPVWIIPEPKVKP